MQALPEVPPSTASTPSPTMPVSFQPMPLVGVAAPQPRIVRATSRSRSVAIGAPSYVAFGDAVSRCILRATFNDRHGEAGKRLRLAGQRESMTDRQIMTGRDPASHRRISMRSSRSRPARRVLPSWAFSAAASLWRGALPTRSRSTKRAGSVGRSTSRFTATTYRSSPSSDRQGHGLPFDLNGATIVLSTTCSIRPDDPAPWTLDRLRPAAGHSAGGAHRPRPPRAADTGGPCGKNVPTSREEIVKSTSPIRRGRRGQHRAWVRASSRLRPPTDDDRRICDHRRSVRGTQSATPAVAWRHRHLIDVDVVTWRRSS